MTPELVPVQPKFTPDDKKWSNLLSQVAIGDEAALSDLYDSTSRLVYGLALRILSDPSEAEEVTLEVYMQVWNKASDYDSSRSSPSGWLLMLTRSRSIDKLRSGSKRNITEEFQESDMETQGTTPEDMALASQQRLIVQDALDKLSPQQRRAIELAYFEGLSQSEISSQMDQPLGTVKSWIRLGMIKLREQLVMLDEGVYGEA